MILRKVEKQVGDTWVQLRMEELQVGDIFRMFEGDELKEPVVGEQGDSIWIVTEPPAPRDRDGILAVACTVYHGY